MCKWCSVEADGCCCIAVIVAVMSRARGQGGCGWASAEVGGERRGFAAAPSERGVLERDRKGAHLTIVAGERGAILDLQVQVGRERVPGVADGGDPLPACDGLTGAHQRAALLEVLEYDIAPSTDAEDDGVALALAEHADRLVSEVVADGHHGAVGRCQHRLTLAVPGRVVLGVTREGLSVDQSGEVEGIAPGRMSVVVAQQPAAAASHHRPLTRQRQVDDTTAALGGGGRAPGRRQEEAEGQDGEVGDGSYAAGGHERQRGESQRRQLHGDGGLVAGDLVELREEDAGVEGEVGERPQGSGDQDERGEQCVVE